ncbi:MAG: integration host factor subunit beta [Planctomycetes bacterium]|nr:integration host factor subunit beta [Planctomycetota bacterium]
MATTKRELVRRVALKTNHKQNIAKDIIQSFLDEVVEELARGNRLEFREFGVFDIMQKKARVARNPRTGATVMVPAKTVVHFKVGRLMKEKVKRIESERKSQEQSEKKPAKSTAASLSGDGNGQKADA